MFKHKYNGIRRMKKIMKSLLEQGGYMTAESNWGCQKKYMRYRYRFFVLCQRTLLHTSYLPVS